MSGNAMEEGLIMQIGNPSHTDPGRISALAGYAVWFVSFIAMTWLPSLGLFFITLVSTTLYFATYAAALWGFARWKVVREARAMGEYRRAAEAQTERLMLEAAADGTFDRYFGGDSLSEPSERKSA